MGGRRTRLKRARKAAGLTQEQLAEQLPADVTSIRDWEAGRSEPMPYRRDKLAELLRITSAQLEDLLQEGTDFAVHSPVPPGAVGGSAIDYDEWAGDLERAMIHFGRQDFPLVDRLVQRWRRRFIPDSSDPVGMSLYGRTLRLVGDLRQDQGHLRGPLSASHYYRQARAVFDDLKAPRRVAQIDLQLAVLEEMAGAHECAADHYSLLADDQRLSERDRTRSLLWVGTALSKCGRSNEAVLFIDPAIRSFDELDEPVDWSIAHQKLALAHRGAGKLDAALAAMDVALANRALDTPMQQVRLDTAQGHILLSDARTAPAGVKLLEESAALAERYGMMHQLESIQSIRLAFEGQAPS
ncbi:helix-turn-helix transcriptional regulator [Amycolatopsis sp. NPDC051373]|uniref:helix-turn-helix domain-containing protein n=1 Tax=Amycolatopsis sp. NPDC051373 TaxID=3155801 RepID=UPI00344BE832